MGRKSNFVFISDNVSRIKPLKVNIKLNKDIGLISPDTFLKDTILYCDDGFETTNEYPDLICVVSSPLIRLMSGIDWLPSFFSINLFLLKVTKLYLALNLLENLFLLFWIFW